MNDRQIAMGVRTQGTSRQLDPRQQRFIELYCDVDSNSFSNCYQSALAAGFSEVTAKNLTHNKPAWYVEKLGQIKAMQPEDLVAKLSGIIDNGAETTANKLKAIDMLLKVHGMYKPQWQQNNVQINIQDVIG